MLSKPEYAREQHLCWVNEGPAVLEKNGKIYMTYSGSGADANYCMGMLTAPVHPEVYSLEFCYV